MRHNTSATLFLSPFPALAKTEAPATEQPINRCEDGHLSVDAAAAVDRGTLFACECDAADLGAEDI